MPSRVIGVSPEKSLVETTLAGKGWAYTVPFAVENAADIEKLIQCESQGVNVSRLDSNGRDSDGILQFNRGPANTLKGGTWESFSKASGIIGSPLYPADAIRLTDWAISHGLLHHWSCAKIMHLAD